MLGSLRVGSPISDRVFVIQVSEAGIQVSLADLCHRFDSYLPNLG